MGHEHDFDRNAGDNRPDYLGAWQRANKIDTAGANRAWTYHTTSSRVPAGRGFDVYGRSGLCDNSLFNLYPGSADCYNCGLIDHETTLRPPYYNSIGGYCDNGYASTADGNVLGYPGGPRGKAYCPDVYAAANSDCAKLTNPQDQFDCEIKKLHFQTRKNAATLRR